MKKILLIIALTLYIFQMVVLAIAIDIGSAAIDRATYTTNAMRTYIDQNNPANESGTITSVEIWANTELSDCEVATFYEISQYHYTTRGTHTIGTVTAGSKQTFSGLSIAVETGDLIGIKYSAGTVERDDSGAGYFYLLSDGIPCDNVQFSTSSSRTISIYGTGTTEEDNAIFFGINF